MAVAGIAAARQRGVLVPDHLSVVGFDDSQLSAFLSAPLTTVPPMSSAGARLRRPPCSPAPRASRSPTSYCPQHNSSPAPPPALSQCARADNQPAEGRRTESALDGNPSRHRPGTGSVFPAEQRRTAMKRPLRPRSPDRRGHRPRRPRPHRLRLRRRRRRRRPHRQGPHHDLVLEQRPGGRLGQADGRPGTPTTPTSR